VPEVLLDPGVNRTPSLINVDLTIFAGDAVGASCFQFKVIRDRLKETDDLPMWEAYSFYGMSRLVSILLMQLKSDHIKCKKATGVGSSLCVFSLQSG